MFYIMAIYAHVSKSSAAGPIVTASMKSVTHKHVGVSETDKRKKEKKTTAIRVPIYLQAWEENYAQNFTTTNVGGNADSFRYRELGKDLRGMDPSAT
jgi:hypothetical protein